MQQPSENRSRINTPTWIDFVANLASFWEGFGSQDGPKLAQIASKMTLQINPKNDHILDRSWDRFWSILGSNLAPKRGGRRGVERTFFALGAKMASRALNEDLETDFGRFLDKCWSIFGRMLADFQMICGTILNDF